MIWRTWPSSIVVRRGPVEANGASPFTMAKARELSVRTCRRGTSTVRSRISSWARLLKATRVRASAGICQPWRSSRARSVRTLVFPEPAGAITRLPPLRWVTAEAWSAASSGGASLDPNGMSAPCSTLTRCTTGCPSTRSTNRTGPPSTQAGRPSGRVTSASVEGVAPSVRAASRHGHTGRVRVAGIDAVRPHEVVEHLEVEGEAGSERVRRALLHRVEGAFEVEVELEHRPHPAVGALAQHVEDRRQLGPVVDHQPLGARPRLGSGLAGPDHHVAAEGLGTGEDRPGPRPHLPVGPADRASVGRLPAEQVGRSCLGGRGRGRRGGRAGADGGDGGVLATAVPAPDHVAGSRTPVRLRAHLASP